MAEDIVSIASDIRDALAPIVQAAEVILEQGRLSQAGADRGAPGASTGGAGSGGSGGVAGVSLKKALAPLGGLGAAATDLGGQALVDATDPFKTRAQSQADFGIGVSNRLLGGDATQALLNYSGAGELYANSQTAFQQAQSLYVSNRLAGGKEDPALANDLFDGFNEQAGLESQARKEFASAVEGRQQAVNDVAIDRLTTALLDLAGKINSLNPASGLNYVDGR